MKATKSITVFMGVLLTACLTLFGQAAYAGIAGHAQFVNGSVQVTNSAGQTRALEKGDVVHESDTVTTAKYSSAQIKMRDGGLIAVRPDSRLKFDSFVFTGEQDGNEKSFFSLIRGGFRAITGLIGQKNKTNYRITTAASTIGIRGTDHEIFVVVPGSELAAIAPVGTYNKVNAGETVMTTNKGTINILPNQMGFAAAADQMPQLQPVNLNIFTAVPPPALQGKSGATDGARGESAVVDGAIQEQNMAPGNAVPTNPTLRPIIEDRGPTAPPRVF
ncbi:MAG: FecR family protein [Gallionella sp.]|nr:FecR family protein [Gallionella sp.]